jgi:hypothetical protein
LAKPADEDTMTDTTPNLSLPYILPSQAMKHVTHNEALQILDAATNSVVVATLAAPPSSPDEGDLFLVDTPASGGWTGKDGKLAFFIDGAWIYIAPKNGWRAWFAADGRTRIFDGSDWVDPLASPVFDMLGVSATPDAANRLSVASEATLFSHAGASHRMKLNKHAVADTASLLLQSNWSGRAEIGLLGDDSLTLKASGDGASWVTGLTMDGNGVVRLPARPLASATLSASTLSLNVGDMVGFDALTLAQGGFALGATLAGGHGQVLVAPAAGLYAVSLRAGLRALAPNSALSLAVNGTAADPRWNAQAATSAIQTAGFAGIVTLATGDALSLAATGSLSLETGGQSLELSLYLL